MCINVEKRGERNGTKKHFALRRSSHRRIDWRSDTHQVIRDIECFHVLISFTASIRGARCTPDENTCVFTRNGTNPAIALAGFFIARWRPFFDNGIVRKIFAERPEYGSRRVVSIGRVIR